MTFSGAQGLTREKDTDRIALSRVDKVVIKDVQSSREAHQKKRLIELAGTGGTQPEGRRFIWALKTEKSF